MKGSKAFEDTIKAYLDKRAETDALFAASYAKEGKNIADCCTYVLNQVQASGCNGFPDDEIFSMAVHYYDEDDIKVGARPAMSSVVVNHTVELTPEEKEEARKRAMERATNEALTKIKEAGAKPKVKKTDTPELPVSVQASLF